MNFKGNSTTQVRDGGAIRRILLSLPVAILFVGVFFIFFPNIDLKVLPPAISDSKVVLLDVKNLSDSEFLRIQELSDDTPLFIPTRWNYVRKTQQLPLPSSWETRPTQSYPLEKSINENLKFEPFSTFQTENSLNLRNSFSGFGRKENVFEPMNQSKILFVLTDQSSGEKIVERFLEFDKSPLGVVEFTVDVLDGGASAKPFLKSSSGDKDFDALVSRRLQSRDLLKSIPVGTYRAEFIP